MEIIVKPSSNDISKYINLQIKNFLLPLKEFSVDYLNYYTLEEIKDIKLKYKDINIFVVINKNIFNDELDSLKNILKELEKINIKGIFFYDISVLSLVKNNNINIDLAWNQTHMVTNYKTCNYYFNKGCRYALASKEITIDEIIEIKNKSKINLIVELVSYPTVAFSKRSLVKNYKKNNNIKNNNDIEILEEKSSQNYYLHEDNNGVSFILKKIMNGSTILRQLLDNDIEYILLKEDLINEDKFMKCIKNINYYINNYKNMSDKEDKKWLKEQESLLGYNTNFFFRKTIYKVKK